MASSRFPKKLLKKINNITVLEHVINKCLEVIDKKNLIIATPDKKIINLCKKIEIDFFNSKKNCFTGTDRIVEFAKKKKFEYYINVQGDEIFLNPNTIIAVIKEIRKNKYDVINCFSRIKTKKIFFSPNVPKVIFNEKDELLYISRAPVPFNKKKKFINGFKQVCVYGFTRNALIKFGSKSYKTFFEEIEDIEILRFLELGLKIKMIETSGSVLAIDTKQDLLLAKKLFKKKYK